MKYLLILLLLFSTQGFSGEIDGKGIECNAIRLATGKTEIDMWWFNNDRVQIVYAQNTKPVTRRPSSEILDINNTFHTYSTNGKSTCCFIASSILWLYNKVNYNAFF